MDKNKILDEIFSNDPFGILDVKVKNPILSNDDRLVESFEEINNFYEKEKREPEKSLDMYERKLYSRLKGIRENPAKIEKLKKYDRFKLLETFTFNSIDDIFESDTFGLLSNDDEDIFTLKNIPKTVNMPSNKAIGKPCKDFEKFEDLFKQVHNDLRNSNRKIIKFQSEQNIEQGDFFILKGVMIYIAHKGLLFEKKGKKNSRLRVIYENGSESNLLMRSLSRELYRDGKRISESNKSLVEKFSNITKDDKQNGYIYILKSLSRDDRIITKKDLYKIGFSSIDVRQRIKKAKNDPTFLMADVKIVSVFEVYNVNPHKLEQLIHKFFGNSCLDMDIIDSDGKIYKPREWFIVPLGIIEKAISLIISGEIVNYTYDRDNECLIQHKNI